MAGKSIGEKFLLNLKKKLASKIWGSTEDLKYDKQANCRLMYKRKGIRDKKGTYKILFKEPVNLFEETRDLKF